MDLVAILVGLYIGFWVRFQSGIFKIGKTSWWNSESFSGPRPLNDYVGLIIVGAILLLLILGQSRLYQSRNLLRFRAVATIILRGTSIWLLVYLALSLVLKFYPPISRIYAAISALAVAILLLGWRAIFHFILRRNSIARRLRQRVIFVGWNLDAARIVSAIHNDSSFPYEVIGFVGTSSSECTQGVGLEMPRLGAIDDLRNILVQHEIDIVIAAEMEGGQGAIALTNLCERSMVQFKVIPSYFQILVSGLKAETISGVPILGVTELPLDNISNRTVKRSIDIVGAIIGIIITAPLVVFFGLLIFFESPGPIIFKQERVGRGGRRFYIFKLRSMHLEAEKFDHINQSTLRNDPRLLKAGAFIRRWNIDETPQFWNVLRSDMSLVGPRPERTFHTAKLSAEIPHYSARLMSKPGMTGWAQINGLRGDTDLAERVRFDLFYLENWSILLDFQIMLQTIFKRPNAY